ncbi:ankyrin repeat-containing domain protein [Aspergillus karnatakaensis]|uniref:ankyrin repeat domain-containing protein n=1 Tax=Aspergillus karnatakaensis TaxID=1810916 RepID=UPI003CCD6EE4
MANTNGRLGRLPYRILSYIFNQADSQKDVSALIRTNRGYYETYTPDLYQKNIDESGQSALWWGVTHGNASTVSKCLENGADPNKSNKDDGTPPLSEAIARSHTDVVNVLLQHAETDVDTPDELGRRPLVFAVMYGDYDLVDRILVGKKARIDDFGKRASYLLLQSAVESRNTNVATLLLEHGCPMSGYGYDALADSIDLGR